MRKSLLFAAVAALAFLVGCGGGGTPQGVPIAVTLSVTSVTINPGQFVDVTATVSNDTSNRGVSWSISPNVGTLTDVTATSVRYNAPTSISSDTTITLTAKSVASSSSTATASITVTGVDVSLTPNAPQTLNPSELLPITATVSNDTNNDGVSWTIVSGPGSLTGETTTSATYNAPSSVTANTLVTIKATSIAKSAATATLEITILPAGSGANGAGAGPNVAATSIDGGLAPPYPNGIFTSVTVCVPGTTLCQTVDGVLVDTGSIGLRLLQSAVPSLALPNVPDASGDTVDNCVSFLDGSFLWGPVVQADIKIGSEAANGVPTQIISSSSSGIPTQCSNGGTLVNTLSTLGANGILGIGSEPTDCILQGADFCDNSQNGIIPVYWLCPNGTCGSSDNPAAVPFNEQVTHPVIAFGTDNNGTVLTLPSLSGAAASVGGTLTFGIATQTNNEVGTHQVLLQDANDNITTLFQSQTLNASFFDSGSNGYFFPSSIEQVCSDNSSFYCTTASLSAINQDSIGNQSAVNFNIDSADTLFTNNPNDSAFSTLAGPLGTAGTCMGGGNGQSCSFDWGIPFFYGRSVFTAIDGQLINNPNLPPWWAY